tara:strand:+ start:62 stop:247 length:186 start_codon:yes stop_codon:yes gene_type:complete
MEYNSINDLKNAASDGANYTNNQIQSLLIDELRRKAYRRGLKSGLIFGVLVGLLITWVIFS